MHESSDINRPGSDDGWNPHAEVPPVDLGDALQAIPSDETLGQLTPTPEADQCDITAPEEAGEGEAAEDMGRIAAVTEVREPVAAADIVFPPNSKEYRLQLAAEIRAATEGAEPYMGGPRIHYGKLRDAYAANVILMCGLERNESTGLLVPSPDTEVLLVQRGSGDGVHHSWSGVSGYIDRPDLEDPLHHTVTTELKEEAGISPEDSDNFGFYVGQLYHIGQRFGEPRRGDGTVHVIPVAMTVGHKPDVRPDGIEVVDHRWAQLGHIAALGGEISFSPGYLDNTLPNALAAFGMTRPEANRLIR